MSLEVADLRGDLVGAGDTIAYAATDGRSSAMRVGKILEVIEPHIKKEYGFEHTVSVKLRVEVEYTTGFSRAKRPVVIDPSFKRFVKVGP